MTTVTQVITTPPTAPARTQPSEDFIINADNHVAWLSTHVSDVNVWASQVNNVASEININAVQTAADRVQTALDVVVTNNNLIAATATANVTKWISGTSYAEGDNTWSPINFQTYRRKVTGSGTTDPSSDFTNWELIGKPPVGATVITYNLYGAL